MIWIDFCFVNSDVLFDVRSHIKCHIKCDVRWHVRYQHHQQSNLKVHLDSMEKERTMNWFLNFFFFFNSDFMSVLISEKGKKKFHSSILRRGIKNMQMINHSKQRRNNYLNIRLLFIRCHYICHWSSKSCFMTDVMSNAKFDIEITGKRHTRKHTTT